MNMSQSKLLESDCTRQCHSLQHAGLFTSAITKRAVSDAALASFFKSTCFNFSKTVDNEGRSLLHMAASRGRRGLAQWLLRQCSSQGLLHVDSRDIESGYTALHRSIFYGQINTAVALMQLGASTCIFDNDDFCAIDHAMLDRPPRIELTKQMPCEVYVWGSNTNYTSGTGSQHHRNIPELLISFTKQNIYIKQVCLSKFHTIFVGINGGVWACGHGEGGRLGVARGDTCVLPTALALPEPCLHAAVARDHTVLLMNSGNILSCGLNEHHQLGQVPPPLMQLSPRAAKLRLPGARGVCAARYHSAAWGPRSLYTWGLNGGQLGHPKDNDKTVIAPKKVLRFGNGPEDCTIESVAVSDGATVAATSKGDVYLMHQYQCKKIASRLHNIKSVSVIGGEVAGGDKLTDAQKQLSVLVLSTLGNIYLWQDSTNHMYRCIFSMNRPVVVVETALIRESVLITTNNGEAFHGNVMPRKSRTAKPPNNSDRGCSPKDSDKKSKSDFHVFIDKDDCILIKLKRLPNIHRAVDICCDNKGNNFAVLQVSPNSGLIELPQVTSSQMTTDMSALLEESNEYDLLHDVTIKVDNHVFHAHRYILSSGSEHFGKLCDSQINKNNTSDSAEKIIIQIDNVHPQIFQQILQYLYTGKSDLTTPGPCTIRIPREKNNSNIKDQVENDNNSDMIVNGNANEAELSAFEVYTKKEKGKKTKSKKEKDKLNKEKVDTQNELFYDPVRLLQEAAKKLLVIGLYKILSNYHYMNGNVLIKESSNKIKDQALCFDRQSLSDQWDTNIKCSDGSIIKAHRCILSARLDYFNGMFAHSWTESSANSTVSLPMNKILLQPIIDFLYTDECPALQQSDDIEFLCNILVISDQLFITRLREMCEVAFANLLTLKNVTEIFQLANTYNCPQLKKCCMEYISLNLPTLLESKSLEAVDKNLLEELTAYYAEFNPVMSSRVITPFSDAVSDDVIMSHFDSYPVNLDDECEEEVIEDMKKDVLSSGKKKTRPRKISFTESEKIRKRNESVSSITSLDLSTENEGVTLSLSKISNNTEEQESKTNGWVKVLNSQQKQNKLVQARLKVINGIRENSMILNCQPESFTKLVKKDNINYDRSLSANSPPIHSPTLQNNTYEFANQSPTSPSSTRDYDNSPGAEYTGRSPQTPLNITIVTKLSQKQRKKLAKEPTIAEQLDKLNTKSSIWDKVDDSPTTDLSPTKNPWQKIESMPVLLQRQKDKLTFSDIVEDERKQKENFSKMMTKPLVLTQLEDQAIEELTRLYASTYADDEKITVKRVACHQIAPPKWINKTFK